MILAQLEVPHVIMLSWLGAGFAALWLAQRLKLSTQKTVNNVLLPMALGLVIFGAYLDVGFNYDFLFDDVDVIELNPDVQDADGWAKLWTHGHTAGRNSDDLYYRPVVMLSYWLNARAPLASVVDDAGNAIEVYPRYFRGVNMVMLALLAWLIALWLRTWVQQAAAWIAAFLFAVHPVHAQVINYVVGRADLLAVLGVVAFLYVQRRSIMQGRWNWRRIVVGLTAAAAAVGSKETGLVLLPAAAAQAWIGRRDASSQITDRIKATPRPTYIWTCVLVLTPTLLYLIGRLYAVGFAIPSSSAPVDDLTANPLLTAAPHERIPAAVSIAWFYSTQVFTPDTSFRQAPQTLPAWFSPTTILGLTLLLVCAAMLIHCLRRRHWMAVVLAIALSQLVIVCNLLQPLGVYTANRLMLPITVAAALAGGGFVHWFCENSTRRRAVAMLPAAAVAIAMAIVIQDINFHWATTSRLTGRDRERQPRNPVLMYHFGLARADEAEFTARYNALLIRAIGLVNQLESERDARPEQLEETVRDIRRDWSDATGLATERPAKQVQHRVEYTTTLRDALDLLYRAVGRDSGVEVTTQDLSEAAQRLSDELSRSETVTQRHLHEARVMLEAAVDARPKTRIGRLALARVYAASGEVRRAEETYGAVLNLSPPQPDTVAIAAQIGIGKLIIEQGDHLDAAASHLRQAEAALEAQLSNTPPPRHARIDQLNILNRDTKRSLGVLAWKSGDLNEAIRRHQQLLKRYPAYAAAAQELKQWLVQRGERPDGTS